jgi:hypothetical protein
MNDDQEDWDSGLGPSSVFDGAEIQVHVREHREGLAGRPFRLALEGQDALLLVGEDVRFPAEDLLR